MDIKTLKGLVGVLSVIILLLLLVIGLLLRDMLSSAEPEVASIAEATSSVDVVAETATVDIVVPTTTVKETATLPPPLVQELSTNTPLPTDTATHTAVATETPLLTDTATATAVPPTNVPPLPTAVPPTATFTPVPPIATPSGPQPTIANGLQGGGFELQEWRTSLTPGGQIWYEWTVINTTNADVPYSTIGVMPRRNGQDVVAWYQNNWGDNNDAMPASSSLTWPSWMSIPEAGDFTLRVVVCFDGYDTCISGGGTFYTLSEEIAVSIR